MKGIIGDYFCEVENFLDDSSIPEIKMFVSSVMEAYDSFTRSIEPFSKYIEENRESDEVDELKRLAEKFISVNYNHTRFHYFSQITETNFTEMHINYFLTQTYPFNNVFKMDDDAKIVENCMNLVLEQNIKKVISIHFHDDIYAGTEVSKIIELGVGCFPEEKLLQEMLICYYSSPRLDTDKNPFQYVQYFEDRFNTFTEDKKLELFVVCNTNKELFMYNPLLTKFFLEYKKR
ncbi:hypothetical protein OA86_04645 [Kaistella jeonii]|uniref:Uncharacterized protein n=1 Tax=Kaistella jeonii TaxID=266749 RepID=A0A0C1CZP9_9FLAO|nr:hypothetical protein OA86_04645 [Kaistella jeonii]